MIEKKQIRKLTVLDSKNTRVEIPFYECNHCNELIPDVGDCRDCGTSYDHQKTVDNFNTGFLHYIYECSGCPEDQRTAQKIIKFPHGIEEKAIKSSKESRRKELADDFLRSGGY